MMTTFSIAPKRLVVLVERNFYYILVKFFDQFFKSQNGVYDPKQGQLALETKLPPVRQFSNDNREIDPKAEHKLCRRETADRILMCRPKYFQVDYVINTHMEGNVHKVSHRRANEQWQKLVYKIKEYAIVELIDPQPGVPDLVFTANAGLVLGDIFILSHFRHQERQGEEPYFKKWFAEKGFKIYEFPTDVYFEGAGDALLDRGAQPVLWAGFGFRSDAQSHPYLAKWLGVEVHSLRLVDERFYHLDTCFCPLEGGYLLYFPTAFDADSNRLIESQVPEEKRIPVDEADAVNFACNAVNIGDLIILYKSSHDLKQRLGRAGFLLIETPVTEFLLSGGATKCLTLKLTEPGWPTDSDDLPSHHPIQLDSSNQESRQPQDFGDVRLEPVTEAGVAPGDNFFITNIYPTEVRIGGQWLLVKNHRMDAVIVVKTAPRFEAKCKLLRELQKGELVVVTGSAGIRVKQKSQKNQEFSFMSSSVSSERKVELVVKQVGSALLTHRDAGWKVVVTAGPVVIHTGGGEHLAYLIRHGFIQALLGGNAIAVHDIEQALYGTSLGVDLNSGVAVPGGHRNHLLAINTIRRYGGIAQAVEQGIVNSGIFYECVTKGVPFALAGSIRDDGPLPDTITDMIMAQKEYARLLHGGDMILLLSSMLHSIGVGNMTPGGVKMLAVDINPAVVTKLSDRGSVESVGVVTDVGLFLSLLVQYLKKFELEHHYKAA